MADMYATFNIQKIQTLAELNGRHKHNKRIVISSNIIQNKIKDDVYGKNDSYKLIRDRIEMVQDIRSKAGARKMRESTVPAVELVLGASHDFFKDMSREDIKDWAYDNVEWAKEYYKGRGHLVSTDLHFSETNPHIHLIFAPETKKVDKHTGKLLPVYSAKEFHGNKSEMNRARSSQAEAMKIWGLRRGRNYYKEGEKPPSYTKSIKELRRQMTKLDEMDVNDIYNAWKAIPEKDDMFKDRKSFNVFEGLLDTLVKEDNKVEMVKEINKVMPPKPKPPGMRM